MYRFVSLPFLASTHAILRASTPRMVEDMPMKMSRSSLVLPKVHLAHIRLCKVRRLRRPEHALVVLQVRFEIKFGLLYYRLELFDSSQHISYQKLQYSSLSELGSASLELLLPQSFRLQLMLLSYKDRNKNIVGYQAQFHRNTPTAVRSSLNSESRGY